tara:strand:- start:29144 stop:29383 length:240 start_codon:yes stop_codon:yes gene_type:complete
MQVSVDGMRRNMTADINWLREAITSVIDELDDNDKQEIIDSFDQVACNQNSFNCMYDDENPLFNDMGEQLEIQLLDDKE